MLEHPKAPFPYNGIETVDETMDNQQAIGKIAGLYLGEGHFILSKKKEKTNWKFHAEIGFSNTDPALIHFICDWLDGLGARYFMHQNSNGCWQIRVTRHVALLAMLNEMEPHLIGRKKHEAALVRRFVEHRIRLNSQKLARIKKLGNNQFSPYGEFEHALCDEKLALRESSETMSIPRISVVDMRDDMAHSVV